MLIKILTLDLTSDLIYSPLCSWPHCSMSNPDSYLCSSASLDVQTDLLQAVATSLACPSQLLRSYKDRTSSQPQAPKEWDCPGGPPPVWPALISSQTLPHPAMIAEVILGRACWQGLLAPTQDKHVALSLLRAIGCRVGLCRECHRLRPQVTLK